jgi:hypothetical protein
MVKSAGAVRASRTLRPRKSDSTVSASGASLVTDAPPGSVIRTGGGSWPAWGGSRNRARQLRMFGQSLGLFALTTFPVAASISA